jgi:hypothetical protein
MHSLALCLAEFLLGASAPSLEVKVFLILFHKMVEPNAGVRQDLSLIQGRAKDLLEREGFRPFLKADYCRLDGTEMGHGGVRCVHT